MARLPDRYTEGWAEDNAIYRTARKTYRCWGNGGPQEHSEACPRTIRPGDTYIEYTGEVPAYQRGDAISMACALAHGYIKEAQ